MHKKLLALIATAFVGGSDAAFASAANCGAGDVPLITTVWDGIAGNGEILADTTWSGTVILSSPVFVKNGATLTIQPGTIVRGQPRQLPAVPPTTNGVPGSLIVTQNGRLVADGQPTNSIIMTTAAVDNDGNNVADDLDANGFKDPYPGFDPAALPSLVPDATPTFYDETCGTAPLAPLDVTGRENVQLWGGVVLLGNAPTNLADASIGLGLLYGQAPIEGLATPGYNIVDTSYGGKLPHDNSGIVRYVSIRHAGDELGLSNELNGLTMGGVGDGTTISFVEVYANFDDGFEWFGGTVNGDHLAAFFVGDDAFDADQGYTGTNQFLVAFQTFFNEVGGNNIFGAESGDTITELDGDDSDANTLDRVNNRLSQDATTNDTTPWPFSGPAFYNVTAIGSTPDGAQDFVPGSPATTNDGLTVRHCFAGDIFNSIMVSTGAETGLEVDTVLEANCSTGHSITNNVNNGFVNLVCSTLDDATPALSALEQTVVTNGDTLSEILRGLAGTVTTDDNSVNPATFDLVNDDTTFNPQGDASGKLVASLKSAPINPRTVQGLGRPNAGCVAPRGTGLDASATFRGAFLFTAPLWTNAWTSLNQAGLLAN